MSLSKGQPKAAAPEQPREAKCNRCRHHGIIVPKKGHMKLCPFLKCECWKCFLITQRTQIAVLERRPQNKPPNQEQRTPCARTVTGVRAVKPAAAADGGARPSRTSGMTCPERTTTSTARSPLDLQRGAAAGGEHVAGLDSGVTSFTSREAGPHKPLNSPFFGEFGQTAPLPVIHFPFRMSGHYPSSYVPCPNYPLDMPWFPPLPAGLYNSGLCGPLMFPHFELGAVHYPPPPEPTPPADCRPVFFTCPLPEAIREELTSLHHPQPPLSNTDSVQRAALQHGDQDSRGTRL